jgi:hypothetical protein
MGHDPEEQLPAEGQAPEEQKSSWSCPFPAPALKTENCFAGFFAPHFGQAGAGSESRRAKCSNPCPHFLHVYS